MRVPFGKTLTLGIWPEPWGWPGWRPCVFREGSNAGGPCGDGTALGLLLRSGFLPASCAVAGGLDGCFAGVFVSVLSTGCFEVAVLWLPSTFFSVFDSFRFAGSSGAEVTCEAFAGFGPGWFGDD